MKLALVLVLAVTAACKDKPKEPAKEPARTAPSGATRPPTVPSAEPSPPPTTTPPVVDAGEPIDAPPTKSELALYARGEFLSKVNKTAKRGSADCGALLAELERMAPEARAMAQRRTEVTGAEVAQDDSMVTTSLRALTRIISACPEKDRFDAFLNVLGDVPR